MHRFAHQLGVLLSVIGIQANGAPPRLVYRISRGADPQVLELEMDSGGVSRRRVMNGETGPWKADRSRVDPQYFFFLAERGLPFPSGSDSQRLRCEIHWKGFPPGWRFTNSFGQQGAGTRTTSTQRFVTTLAELKKAIFFGGDFRVNRTARGGPYLVTRGTWRFGDANLVRLLDQIHRVERSVWKDKGLSGYLIAILPTIEPEGHWQGEARTHAFVLYGSQETAEASAFAFGLAHEMFHEWNPHRLNRPDNEQLYWFTEGVTDFYAAVTMLRAGLWNLERFVANYNQMARQYFGSPKRNLPAAQMVAERQIDHHAQRLPYLQGFLLGANWNAEIRQRSSGRRSLDDAMQYLLRTSNVELSNKRIAEALAAAGWSEAASEIQRFVIRGESIVVSRSVLGGCTSPQPFAARFDIGFKLEQSTKEDRIIGVDPNSNAYRAGLRDGQRLLSRDYVLGDPGYRAGFEVEDDQGRRWIRFEPAAIQDIPTPQFRLESTGATCDALFR